MDYSNLKARLPYKDVGLQKMFEHRGFTFVDAGMAADVLVLGGGADIIPFLYGEKPLSCVSTDYERDVQEIRAIKMFASFKPRVGICRGAQLLNVLSGGRMFQDVDSHAGGRHDLIDDTTGEKVYVTSTHHQMMRPDGNAKVLARAGLATKKITDSYSFPVQQVVADLRTWEDVEVCYYQHSKSLCFQPHPEYGLKSCEDYFWRLFDMYTMPVIQQNRIAAEKLIALSKKEAA